MTLVNLQNYAMSITIDPFQRFLGSPLQLRAVSSREWIILAHFFGGSPYFRERLIEMRVSLVSCMRFDSLSSRDLAHFSRERLNNKLLYTRNIKIYYGDESKEYKTRVYFLKK